MTDSSNRQPEGSQSGGSANPRRYRHEAVLYDSEEEFLGVVVPFLQDGVAAGEPSLVALGPATVGLVRATLGDAAGVTFLGDSGRYRRPASVIRSHQAVLAAHVADGASQIRVVGDVPHPGLGVPWDGWARYEATINHAYAGFPLWGLCPYDTRITPDPVLDDVARTHSHLTTTDGHHQPNPHYQDPIDFLTRRPSSDADPLETASPPLIDLIDPTPAAARHAVHAISATLPANTKPDIPPANTPQPDTPQLDARQPDTPRSHTPQFDAPSFDVVDVDDLVLAVSEAVSNALTHGRGPVRFRLWTGPDRIVATVTDRGAGPTDPFVGLLPTTSTSSAGLGLWLTHQICSHVTLDRTDDGFTIRLVAGMPHSGRT